MFEKERVSTRGGIGFLFSGTTSQGLCLLSQSLLERAHSYFLLFCNTRTDCHHNCCFGLPTPFSISGVPVTLVTPDEKQMFLAQSFGFSQCISCAAPFSGWGSGDSALEHEVSSSHWDTHNREQRFPKCGLWPTIRNCYCAIPPFLIWPISNHTLPHFPLPRPLPQPMNGRGRVAPNTCPGRSTESDLHMPLHLPLGCLANQWSIRENLRNRSLVLNNWWITGLAGGLARQTTDRA